LWKSIDLSSPPMTESVIGSDSNSASYQPGSVFTPCG
jgi:hypothetical protein